ncbi:MAG: MFS transporter [Thermoleophilia bacterium]|jgi:MFS family permease
MVVVLATCAVAVIVMQTVVLPLIPDLPRILNTSVGNASWVVTITLLVAAVTTPIGGRLGDMFGKKRVLLISLTGLVLGSVLCATARSLGPMIVGRALHGVATPAIPLGIGILRDELPPARLGPAIATVSTWKGAGGAIGLVISALLILVTDWHVMFWMAAVLGVVCLVSAAVFIPESSVRTGGRFDVPGALGLSVGLVALLLAISKGADWGWGSVTTLTLFAAAVVVLVGWGMIEVRTVDPSVNLRATARPQVLYTNLASLLIGFAFFAQNLVFIQQLMASRATGYGLGLSMFEAALALAPGGVAMILVAGPAARLMALKGAKATLITGAAVVALGYLVALFFGEAVWEIMVAAVIIGAGIGAAYAAAPALIVGAVPQSETSEANGVNSLVRSIGGSISAAVLGAVLAHMTVQVGETILPSRSGFRVAFLFAIAAAIAAVACAALIPSNSRDSRYAGC